MPPPPKKKNTAGTSGCYHICNQKGEDVQCNRNARSSRDADLGKEAETPAASKSLEHPKMTILMSNDFGNDYVKDHLCSVGIRRWTTNYLRQTSLPGYLQWTDQGETEMITVVMHT